MKKLEIEIVEDQTGFTMNCHHDDTHATAAEVMFWNATVDLIRSVNKFGNDLERAGKRKFISRLSNGKAVRHERVS